MTIDFLFTNHGSITTLLPLTKAAKQWVADHLPEDALTFGKATVIEPRYAGTILEGLVADGLTVSQ